MLSNRFRFAALLLVALLLSSLANTLSLTSTWWRITFDPAAPLPWHRSAAQKIFTIKLTNVTDHVAWAAETDPVNDYQVAITDSSGKFVPMTAAGLREQKNLRSTITRALFESVPPGSSRTSQINLAEFYDLSPGKYVVEAMLRAPTEESMDEKTNHRKPNAPEPSSSTTIAITQ